MKVYQCLEVRDDYSNSIRYLEDSLFLKEEDAIKCCKEKLEEYKEYRKQEYEDDIEFFGSSSMEQLEYDSLYVGKKTLKEIKNNPFKYRGCFFYIEVTIQ